MANVGFYGKIPSQGDFVRVNAADPVCLAFDQWMAESLDASQRGGIPFPQEPVNFLFRAPGARNVLVGAFSPSNDSVGRQYPMVVFALVDLAAIATRYPAVSVLYGSFFAAAYAIIGQGSHLPAARLGEMVRSLPSPTPTDATTADTVCRRTLDTTPASDLHRRLFGDANAGKQYYAFRTFLNACEPVRAKEPGKANVTLDCPVASDVDVFTWLEMTRRLLRWPGGPPSFFWSEGNTPRLLIALGPPPPNTLVYLSKPDHGGAKLWPLQTERSDAIEAAKQQLAAVHRQVLDDPAVNLETLLSVLCA